MAPGYFSILKAAVGGGTRRLLTEQEGPFQDSVEQLLFGQGRLLLSKSRSLHSTIGHSNNLLQGSTAFTGRSGSAANQSSSLTAVGALYRTLSTPSASGPSLQICGYHVDCLLQSLREGSINSKPQKAPTAAYSLSDPVTASSIHNVAQRCGQPRGRGSTNFNGRLTINGNFDSCRKSSMILKGKQNVYLARGYFTFSGPSRWKSDSWLGSNLRESHSSSSASVSTDASSDAPFDNSAHLPNYPVSSEQKAPGDRILKLVSGSCYLPHPDKESTGGEDAHFICDDEQAIGVADGVGGWADLGVNAGLFAQELMSHSVNAIQEEPKGLVDPSRVLGKAHSSTKARGSSTACIIALTEKGLHAINLGDSGFMVVRDGCTIFRSPVQQHDFNFTYQLESGNGGDLPSSGQVFSVSVAPGDVIIAGTDGLFDNLYNNEVTAVVVHAVRAGLGPQVTAQKIAALARQRAQDRDRQTPFSTAAQDAGLRYYGGKLDDITVVVSFITSINGGRST